MIDRILKEEGEGYTEYLHCMFRAYLASDSTKIVDAIKDERRRWTQDKLGAAYTCLDLMKLGRLTYNNLVDNESWNGKPAKSKYAEKNTCSWPQSRSPSLTVIGEIMENHLENRGMGFKTMALVRTFHGASRTKVISLQSMVGDVP